MPFRGLIGYVSGGATGIGFETMRKLLQQNMKGVLFTDTRCPEGVAAEDCLNKEFGTGRALFMECDATTEECILKAMCKTIDVFCNIDVVFNNAGIICEENWIKTIKVHYNSVVIGTRLAMTEFFPRYKTGPCGHILNNLSITAMNVLHSIPQESSSKHAALSFSRAVGTPLYFKKYKTIVSNILPGITKTQILDYGGKRFKEETCNLPVQEPCHAAAHASCIIQAHKNGSVWISEGGDYYEVNPGTRECLRNCF